MTILLQIRRDSASAWNVNNPTLLFGEFGWDSTNKRLKVGDGSTAWSLLEYSTFTQSDLDNKLNISASSSFLPMAASANYLPIGASANYLPIGASANYLTISSSSNYLLISASNNFAPATIGTNAQTGTSYTLSLSDIGKVIEMNNANANLVIIPLNATAPFPIGTQIDIIQIGAGATSASIVSGVTLNSDTNKRTINSQWSGATLIKRSTDTWIMMGAIKA